MYKVVIADDESIIRKGLGVIVDWEEMGFEITEVFSDGEQIIDYLGYSIPDVILTDVKMTNVSGIDVAKYVAENRIPAKVILVSGFNEFKLAVEALKYGVYDYLLKPVIPAELKKTFEKLHKDLDEVKAKNKELAREKEELQELRSILETQFLEEVMLGTVEDRDYITKQFQRIYPHLDIETTGCFVFDIMVKEFEHFVQNVWEYGYDQFEDSVNNFLKIFSEEYFFRIVYKKRDVMRILAIQCHSGLEIEEATVRNCIENVCKEMEIFFSIQIEHVTQGIYENLYRLNEQGKQGSQSSKEAELFYKTQLNEQIQMMLSNVLTRNYTKARSLCHGILDAMEGYSDVRRNKEMHKIFMNLCEALSYMDPELKQKVLSFIDESGLWSASGSRAMREYCDRLFAYIGMTEKQDYSSANGLVEQAKKLIADNIYRDISREEIAGKLYICPAYLGKLFVKDTGETFSAYVNKLKVNKAIELLKKPNIKNSQIGEMLGFTSPKYFGRVFKAHTGMTPVEYRREVLSIGGNINEE